jgi:putative hemolysin
MMNQLPRLLAATRDYFDIQSFRTKRPLQVRLARTTADVRAAQQLRYEVFKREMTANQFEHRLVDSDHYDKYCQHLIVVDTLIGQVVGTYRILSSDASIRAGGFYSEQCFSFDRLATVRDQCVELGRSCVHPDYRDGTVIRMLWNGLAQVLANRPEKYIIGCPSVSAADGGLLGAALYTQLTPKYMAGSHFRVSPKVPLPVEKFRYSIDPVIPPLIRGYLKLGGLIAGEPHHDVQFGSVDFFMVLPTVLLTKRVQPNRSNDFHPDEIEQEFAAN